jgi:hypothetical protein
MHNDFPAFNGGKTVNKFSLLPNVWLKKAAIAIGKLWQRTGVSYLSRESRITGMVHYSTSATTKNFRDCLTHWN